MKITTGITLTVVGLAIFYSLLILPFFGFHIITTNGEHIGYITAIEKTGIFSKTYTAYVKTDTQSSQEDSYCVADPSLVPAIASFAESKTRVRITYFDWLSKGIARCDHEMAGVISSVSAAN